MQPAEYSFRQHVVPHAPGPIGPIARKEAGPNLRTELFIVAAALTTRSCEPGIEAASRDTERLAHPVHWPDPPVLRDESEFHVDSFASRPRLFFRMSRSAISFVTSRLRRAI